MKNLTKEKICAFYASDYHFEMISLPYISKSMDENKEIIILTENDLEDTVKTLISRMNLKDAKKNLFLYTLPEDKRADLKILPEKINSKRLSFANENDLQTYLGLIPGAVTPLGIINDKGQKVTVVLDKELKNNKVLIHPNRNTATVSIKYDNLIKFIKHCGNKYLEI